jgi:hypothetical protein
VGPGEAYEHWDEYLVACTVHSGDHWVADNTAVYTILSALIRHGPGWHYIPPSSRKKTDGRALWLRLLAHAYDVSNVDRICEECRTFYATQTYNGPTRHMDFDKYCNSWYENNQILEYHDRLPPQRDIVADFIKSLDLNSLVFQTAAMDVRQSEIKRNDFDKAITAFKTAIGNNPDTRKRGISEMNGGAAAGRADIRNKDYSKSTLPFVPKEEWNQMTSTQQADFKKAKAKDRKRRMNRSNHNNQRANQSNQSNSDKFEKRIRKTLAAIAKEHASDSSTPKDNAGDQFGAQAHGNGSSKKKKNQ